MKDRITYLDLVIPLVIIYTTGLIFWAYFIKTDDYSNPILDVIIIFLTSTFFCYGVLAFFRDLKRLGVIKFIKNITNEIDR